MRNAGLEETQAGINIAGRNINNLIYADDTTLVAESEEEVQSLLIKLKEENDKSALKLNIQKTKIMASCPITSWQIDWDNVEKFQISFSWAPKSMWMVTAPGNQKMLAPWKKSYDKARQYIKKQRHGFADKYPYSQSYALPVVMYGWFYQQSSQSIVPCIM